MTNVAPSPRYPERAAHTYGEVIAQNGRRSGPRQASEQLVERDPSIGAAFGQGATIGRAGAPQERAPQVYDAQIAGQSAGRTPLASGASANPTWLPVSARERANFSGSADFGEPGEAQPFPHAPRAGANLQPLTPLDGLARGERQGTVYGKAYAPPAGGRGRKNPSDVTTSEL